ncbi:MAG: helix-turn-helix transcriptional regulator [Gemmatimonadales bacterium]|nr:helix-turn-helix transcriptional regulator [Gemmatimonadales bacterium]
MEWRPQFSRRLETLLIVEASCPADLVPFFEWAIDNARNSPSVRDMAAAAAIKPRALEYRFAAHRVMRPGKVLWWARILHAVDLLGRTTLTADDVAMICGYSSSAVLSKGLRRVGLRVREVRSKDGFRLALQNFRASLQHGSHGGPTVT